MKAPVIFAAMMAFIVPVMVVVAMNWEAIQSWENAPAAEGRLLYFYSPS